MQPKVRILKNTTVQSYGEFYRIYVNLKNMLLGNPNFDPYDFKVTALVMLCFSIEAFANQIGEDVFNSWKGFERGISPMGKLKLLIETLKVEMAYEATPFNEVNQIMKWRNSVAHAKTEKWTTSVVIDKRDEKNKTAKPGAYRMAKSCPEHGFRKDRWPLPVNDVVDP